MSLVIKTANILAMAAGEHTTVAAADSVTTGLREVLFAVACLSSDSAADSTYATVAVPSQVSSPGVITIKTWQPTAGGNTAPTAATAFTKTVQWLAFGK